MSERIADEDAVDCNQMRRAPILKIACKRMPLNGEEMLASQPTMTRLENQVLTVR